MNKTCVILVTIAYIYPSESIDLAAVVHATAETSVDRR